MLDPDLVNLAFQLPAPFKQHGAQGKWIFKKAMEGVLPDDIIWRPKTGFGAPIRTWLQGPLRGLVQDTLRSSALAEGGVFEPKAVGRLLDANDKGQVDASYTLFAIVCIEYWRRLFLTSGRMAVAAPSAAPR